MRALLLFNLFGESNTINGITFCDCNIAVNFIIEKCFVDMPSIIEESNCTNINCLYTSYKTFPLVRIDSSVLQNKIENLNLAINAAFPPTSYCAICNGNITTERSFGNHLFIEVSWIIKKK